MSDARKISRRVLLTAGAVAVVAGGLGWGWSIGDRYAPPRPLPAPGPLRGSALDQVVGGYRLRIGPRQWQVTSPGGVVVWDVPHAPVTALVGGVEWQERVGHFTPDQSVVAMSADFTVTRVEAAGNEVVVTGVVVVRTRSLHGAVRLRAVDAERLAVEVDFPGADAVVLRFDRSGEGVRGLGVQCAPFDHSGRFVPVVTREQGIGRGGQPLTWLAEATQGAGGDRFAAYAPVPFALVGQGRAIGSETTDYTTWDARDDARLDVTAWSERVEVTVYSGTGAAEVVSARTGDTGRPPVPPRWALEGAIVGLQGGSAEVRRKLGVVRAAGAPVSAVWLQDWVGQRTTSFGERLWWTWEVDRDRYPDWDDLVAELADEGVRVLTYVNPFLVTGKPGVRRDLYAEAERLGHLVRHPDGGAYLLGQGEFTAALVDLSDPGAREWFTDVIARQVAGAGASGWMADFGEGLPFDAVIAGGDAAAWHNRWPDLWARVNRDARERAGVPDAVVFHRSAGPLSPGLAPMLWAGDQTTTFDGHDGLRSALHGMLAAGASGFPLIHSDTGGYTGLDRPVVGVSRSPELLARWAELSAWGAVLRTHEGNRPAESAQVHQVEHAAAFAAQARVFAALVDYRIAAVEHACTTGVPVLRHGFLLDMPTTDDQYFFGESFLVAPVLDEGATTVRALLPPGRWVHLWTGEEHGDPAAAVEVTVPAPLGRPGVFHRVEDAVAARHAVAVRAASGA
ncbi:MULTISPECIES: alpha-glucosidase [Saccharothrix]|uniref:alpha-glucosidase n=1 Tax=Saccharothrix TaxID=2071 RepID=UPI000967EA7E|nr:alpha-glucosidase [Saccharothrix sp. CB00851]OKI28637.1 hypothetical protein A6A25_30985 [Saccharothrix sp. CB00851]